MEYLLFLPLFGPGLALTFWLVPDKELNWFDRTILGLGIGLAFYPVFLLWCYITGIPINQFVVFSMLIISFVLLIWQLYPSFKKIRRLELSSFKVNVSVPWLFLLIVLALSAYVRIAIVKDLQIPMWADSYHHTMISQLIIDNNGLFSSWLPYAPLKTFTYHFGFHSIVANYHWLTGLAIPRSVIVVGQMINFLAVLTCYLLAKQLTGKQWAGNVAALFVGLISMMPAYYVNWGRYPQLTGLAILPIAIVLTVHLFSQLNFNKKLLFITAFVIAGLGLSHYGVLVFFILFGAILLVYKLIDFRFDKTRLRFLFINLLGTATVVALLAGPWVWIFFAGKYWTHIKNTIAAGNENPTIQAHNALEDITFFVQPHWYALIMLGGLWSLWKKEKFVIIISIWGLSLLLLANPYYLQLPGTGLINNFAVFISIFLPSSVILGNLYADIILKTQDRHPAIISIMAILLLLLGLQSARFRITTFLPQNQLVTQNDSEAMIWIQNNTPRSAKFLVNSFFAYGNSVVVGSDAGWWLPLLAARQNSIPPMVYYQEVKIDPDDREKLTIFNRKAKSIDLTTCEGWGFLRNAGITHIFIGQQNGQVWYESVWPDENNILNADALDASSYYRIVYQQDQVSILEVYDDITQCK